MQGTEAYFTCAEGVFGSPCGDYQSDTPPQDVIFSNQPYTGAGAAGANLIAYHYIDGTGGAFQFPIGAFEQPGTYRNYQSFANDSSGTLTVALTSVPEPTSVALAGAGLLTLAAFLLYRARLW
jgi:hypothetical protein